MIFCEDGSIHTSYWGSKSGFDKLTAAVGREYVAFLASQGPDVLNARVETFIQYETALVGQPQSQVASAMPKSYVAMPEEEAKRRSLRVDVKHYSRKEGGNLALWIRKVEMAMMSFLTSLEHQRVPLVIS